MRSQAHRACVVEEEQGFSQLRFYPTCTPCGWYPLHERTLSAALEVADRHNARRHPDSGPPIVVQVWSPALEVLKHRR